MTGRAYLVLAQQLVNMSDEAAWRSGISRGYYAAFHVCRDFMEWLRFQVPASDRAHAYLWLRLRNSGDALVGQAGSDLNNLRTMRNRADYDFRTVVVQIDARTEVQAAEDVILAIEAVMHDPGKATAARDAMVVYERDVLKDVTWAP